MKYFRFYIQKEGTDSSGAAYPIKESGKDFNVYEKECKFYGGRETKDIPKRDWYDQNGDDEFTPTTPVYKSQDVDVKFAYKGALFSANAYIKNFMEYLATGGTMKIYDEYNRIGRQSVRFVGIPDDAELHRKKDGADEALIFTVKLKVNDPVTDVTIETDTDGNVTGLKA